MGKDGDDMSNNEVLPEKRPRGNPNFYKGMPAGYSVGFRRR